MSLPYDSFPAANPEALPEPIERFYVGLDERFGTLALTLPVTGASLPDSPHLKSPATPIVLSYDNQGYLVPTSPAEAEAKRYFGDVDRGWNVNRITEQSGTPRLESINILGKLISADELEASRNAYIEDYLASVFEGADKLNAFREGQEIEGLGAGNFLYRAPYTPVRMKVGGVMMLNHLDPSANFENQAMFDGDSSQVKYFAKDPGYAGEIIRLRIEEPAFYMRAGFPVPRICPLFPHYLTADNIEVSRDEGQTWLPAVEPVDSSTNLVVPDL